MPRNGPNGAGVFAPNELRPCRQCVGWKGSSMSGPLNISQRWRKLAGDARRHAAGIPDVESKQAILNAADSYDFLAEQANERAEENRQLRGERRSPARW